MSSLADFHPTEHPEPLMIMSKHVMHHSNLRSRSLLLLAMTFSIMAFEGQKSEAGLVISFTTVSYSPGQSGSVEVDLTNTDPSNAVPINGYSYQMDSTNSGLIFTNATTGSGTTNYPYIFDGTDAFGVPNSLANAILSGDTTSTLTPPSGSSLSSIVASDIYLTPNSNVFIAPDSTVSLGFVFFTTTAEAPANEIPIVFNYTGGFTGISTYAVPEPVSLGMMVQGFLCLGYIAQRKFRTNRNLQG